MVQWFAQNLINIVIVAVLIVVVSLIIMGMIKDRKSGKGVCGGNCNACRGGCTQCGSEPGDQTHT